MRDVCSVCGLPMADTGPTYKRSIWLDWAGKRALLFEELRHAWDANARDDWTAVRTYVIGAGRFDA